MKGQSRKIVSEYIEPGKGIDESGLENLRDAQDRAEAEGRIERIKSLSRNAVADYLDQKTFITEWTHPCLFNKATNRQVSVSEFYPALNLALDKFYHYDEWEIRLTDFKRKALLENGFKYVVLTPDKDLADIKAEIMIQEK